MTSVSASVIPVEREIVEQERRRLHDRLLRGAPGSEIVGRLTEFVDGVLVQRFDQSVRAGDGSAAGALAQHCCLVALGGYGRRELAPFSDVDLMLLYRPEIRSSIDVLSRRVVHDVWDLGFKLGHSVRTIGECLDLAAQDLTVRTSMMEARFLAGDAALFQEFSRRYIRRIVLRGGDRFLDAKLAERHREYEKFGETVYLLEPNVKKSKGGLRDLHMLQWVGMARFEAQTIRDLADRGLLSRPDYLALTDAQDFLWRVRAHLHLQAGLAQEILTFEEQVRLAAMFGFTDQPHLLAVEQFMRQYYRHTGALHEIATRFVERCRRGSWRERLARLLPARRVGEHFMILGRTVTVPISHRARVLQSPALLLRLFRLAQDRGLRIDTELQDEMHRQLQVLPESAFRTAEVSGIFLEILGAPEGVAETLEAMHRAHLLEKLIPVFGEVRGLMQFNQYHKYTVDEHSLLAVGQAERLRRAPGLLGDIYREVQRKDLLHLAILLHDLGKGHELDHSEVGRALAEDTAARFALDEQETRALVFLVHRHLLMAHTAFRRDPYDEKVLLTFSRTVGTPDVLRKLLILTAADIAAVGPGMLTKWKESLLVELYLRAHAQLTGGQQEAAPPERLGPLAQDVLAALLQADPEGRWDAATVEAQLGRFPPRYLSTTPVPRMAVHLRALSQLSPGDVRVEYGFHEGLGTSEYSVITTNDLTVGLFSKIAGAMAAKGLQILDAQIVTGEDGLVVDTFQVVDPDYAGAPPDERWRFLADTIRGVLKGELDVETLLAHGSRLPGRPFPASREVAEVQVDTETSDRYTILEVFAPDRQGLLYAITRAILRLGLSVHAARISTRLDQAADVFYVTNHDGVRPEEPAQLEEIRNTIARAIDRFLLEGLESVCRGPEVPERPHLSGDVLKGGSA